MNRSRSIVLLLLAVLAAGLLAGCGGGSAKPGSSGADVNELLRDTFSSKKTVQSGKLEVSLDVAATGGQGANGPFSMRLSGPFQSQGPGKLPKFAIAASLEGAGKSFKAGATSTGEKGFVSFQGKNYVVSDQVFKQFKAGYEEAQRRSKSPQSASPATLGIDPRRWLKDARNAGETNVGDTDAIHITGTVDVPKLLDDLNTALSRASALGLQGTQKIPQRLTEQQKRQAAQAIKHLKVDIYTGKDDHTLRRMTVNLDLAQGGQSAKVAFDLSLTDLNNDQAIAAPANAKPFSRLLSQLGALQGALGGSPSSSGGASRGGSAGTANIEKYSKCLEHAGNDTAKARKCADLLTP